MPYGSDAEFTAWLASMGLSLPEGSPTPLVLRTVGSAYVDAMYGARYTGRVASVDQELEWPRVGAYRGFAPMPTDLVPLGVIHASYHAGYYAAVNPGSFFTGGTGSSLVKRETVGPLTFEYAVPSNWTQEQLAILLAPVIPMLEGLLTPYLLDPNAKGITLMTIGGCDEYV
ncbi:hypothetical protein [Rhizobium phage RHph_X3_2]|nr:hypothetical protein [Rhizobium phage RHph_X3_2]